MVDRADAVRRDIAMTRERMASALSELEQKVNVMQMVRDHPWPALGIALGTGIVLSRAGNDAKAAATAGAVARGVRSRTSVLIDEVVSGLLLGLGELAQVQIDRLIDEVKEEWHGRARNRGSTAPGAVD